MPQGPNRRVGERYVASPKELEKKLNLFLDPVGQNSTDLLIRGAYWLAFAGLKISDIYDIKISNILLKNKVVHYGRRVYRLRDEAIPTITRLIDLEKFWYFHPNYEPKLRPRKQSDYLLRGIRSEHLSESALGCMIRNKSAGTGFNIELKSAQLSGIYYDILEGELAGAEINFLAIATEMNPPDSTVKLNQKKASLLREGYLEWRSVFYPEMGNDDLKEF